MVECVCDISCVMRSLVIEAVFISVPFLMAKPNKTLLRVNNAFQFQN